ncbi:MAG: hypothetical protein D4R67_06620 [Bacteroidetes bacterium]|nr:MAG: hypothetical protein D4R67_06620 [Bacteroidota bacterium]
MAEVKCGMMAYYDIVISPDLKGMPLLSSKDNDQMFQAGVKAAQEAISGIREILIERNVIR